ncbi:hypothetical protein KIPB_009199, partial [Kipferlia bialata]
NHFYGLVKGKKAQINALAGRKLN